VIFYSLPPLDKIEITCYNINEIRGNKIAEQGANKKCPCNSTSSSYWELRLGKNSSLKEFKKGKEIHLPQRGNQYWFLAYGR